MATYQCGFCSHFKKLKVLKQYKDEPDIKKCHINKCKVTSDTREDCDYFAPIPSFYCTNNNCYLDLIQCISRRQNRKGLAAWKNCESCRQWDTVLRDIVIDFILDQIPIKKPPKDKKRTLKRRSGNARAANSSRKLKRRTNKPKRELKRRKRK